MLFEIPMIVFLATFGFIYLTITFKIRRLPQKASKDFMNELINSAMWFVGAAIYPFSYTQDFNDPVIKNYFNIFTDCAMIGIFIVIFVIMSRQKMITKRDPALKKSRDFELFAANFKSEYTLGKDISARLFTSSFPCSSCSCMSWGIYLSPGCRSPLSRGTISASF